MREQKQQATNVASEQASACTEPAQRVNSKMKAPICGNNYKFVWCFSLQEPSSVTFDFFCAQG